MTDLPDISDIRAAAETLRGEAVRTPLINSRVLDDLVGGQIFLKSENLQRTGSFKFRGGYNAVSNLPASAAQTGVLACSSGNHAQGVAEAARLMGYKATILMPQDAPETKKERTKRSGAGVVEYDRWTQDRDTVVQEMADKSGAPIIHPYETFHVIAGQGTVGLEIAEDMQAMGLVPDHYLVCTGGGGLLAGSALGLTSSFPDVQMHTVEPEGHDDQRRSHEAGERLGGNSKNPSVCDAIVTPMPGFKSFAMCLGKLGQGLVISDEEALKAVAFAFRELKLVVEPGGAAALAAILSGKLDVRGKTIVATLSGGNIDAAMMARALEL
ncbi:MAG: threonine/serine dehydratase [Pseudomonadota bacterium]